MSENTLFYSKYCKHCKHFILQLKAHNLLDYFSKKICIDNPQIRNNLPPFLTEVPTIIVDDYDKPIASDIAFKWIAFKVKDMQQRQSQQQPVTQNSNQQCAPSDPQCFSFNNKFDNFGSLETGSAYGGLGDATSLKKGGKGSTGSINYEAFALITPEEAGKKGGTGSIDYDSFSLAGGQNNQVQNSENSGDFDKRLEKMQKMRAMDNNFYDKGH